MNDKQLVVTSPEVRKALSKLRMEMVRQAQVKIKNIFPALGMKLGKKKTSKRPSFTKKGPGRYHPNVAEIAAREPKKQKEETVAA